MNKKSLIFAVFYAVLAVVACFSVGCSINDLIKIDYLIYENADEYFIGDKTYVNDGTITSVNVDWIIGNVTVKSGENFEIKELFSGLGEAKKVRSAVINGELKIKFWKSGYLDTCNKAAGEKDVEITVPNGIDLSLDGTSCAYVAKSINAKKLNIGLISGKFSSDEVVCESLICSLTSASFSVEKAEVFSAAELSSISGALKIGEFSGKSLSFESTSGNVSVTLKNCEKLVAETINGKVNINSGENGATVEFSTISGKLKAESSYVVNGGKYVFGGGACKISVETTSGWLTIK